MSSLAWHESERELIAAEAENLLLRSYLYDISKFEALESGYEFLTNNAANIQRALRNLDDAIKGKEYACDAIFTALNYVMCSLREVAHEEVNDSLMSAEEAQWEARRTA